MKLIVEKTGEIRLSDDEKTTSKEEIGKEKDVSVHETEISLTVIPLKDR